MAVRSSRISTAALADTLAKFAQQKEPTLTKEVAYELWLTAAQLHAQAGKPAKANLELGRVLKKFPCKTCLLPDEITNLMADNELAARRFPQALKIYQENLRLYLDKEKWRLVLPQYGRIGRLYTAWGKTDEAEQTYLGVEQTCRKRNFVLPPEQAFALAQLYEKKGQNEKAIAYANKTLKAMNLFAQDLTRPELLPSPATEAVALLRRLVQPIGATDTENAEFVIHTTGETETLESIGKLYDVSVECLYDWNFVPSPVLAKGSRVKVCRRADWQRVDDPEHPLPGNQPVVYKVKEGQTLTMVARIHKVELAQLYQWNRETAATPDYLQPNTEVIVDWVFKQCSCGK